MTSTTDPQSVLVIGASRGIGAAIAQQFLDQGHNVVGTHRGSGVPDGVVGFQADITDNDQIRAAFDHADQVHGPVDVLVVASGIARDDLLLRMGREKIDDVLETNLVGPMLAAKAALKPMMKKRSGSIVFVSSLSARYGVPGQTNYTASKAGLEGFARSFAREYASRGIRINLVSPGATDTEMMAGVSDDMKKQMLDAVPMGRFAKPEEVAHVVYWVSQSTFMTGATVPVSGGMPI